MKHSHSGIIRRIDELGRIVIPKEVRRGWGVSENDPIEIFSEDGYVVLQKYLPYEEDNIANNLEFLATYYDGLGDSKRAKTLREMKEDLRSKR